MCQTRLGEHRSRGLLLRERLKAIRARVRSTNGVPAFCSEGVPAIF